LTRCLNDSVLITRHGDTIYVSGLPPFDSASGEVAKQHPERHIPRVERIEPAEAPPKE